MAHLLTTRARALASKRQQPAPTPQPARKLGPFTRFCCVLLTLLLAPLLLLGFLLVGERSSH